MSLFFQAIDDLLKDILVGNISLGLTVIEQVAVLLLLVFTVIVAVPADFAVTNPFDTVATEVLELLQVTLLSVALLGLIVAIKFRVSPISNVTEV